MLSLYLPLECLQMASLHGGLRVAGILRGYLKAPKVIVHTGTRKYCMASCDLTSEVPEHKCHLTVCSSKSLSVAQGQGKEIRLRLLKGRKAKNLW